MGLRKRFKRIFFRFKGEEKHVEPLEIPIVPTSDTEAQIAVSVSSEIPELILYGRDSCPYCYRVKQEIETLGIEEHIVFRDTSFRSKWRTDLQEKTGRTQVPCLFIDGEPLFESLDIIAWLAANVAR